MSARAYTEAEIERIAKALAPEAYREQEGWVTRCPCEGHEDVHPSLKLDIGRDGRLLCYCRGGCGKREGGGALKARGLLPQPDGPHPGGGPEGAAPGPGGRSAP